MTKNEAQKLGNLLLKKLGVEWELEIRENLGWHYAATNGPLNVFESYNGENGKPTYTCLMSDIPKFDGGGAGIWHLDENQSVDPWLSIQRQIKEARKVVDKLNTTVKIAEKILIIKGR